MYPRMLTIARESRGLSQTELARISGIPQGTISKAENGLTELPEERVQAIADALDYPRDLLDWPDPIYGFGSSMFHHRKQQSVGQTVLRRLHATVNLLIARLRRLSIGIDIEAPLPFPALDIDSFDGSPEEVARAVRAAWLAPMGPVENMIRLVEAAGATVLRRDLGSPRITAVSIRPPGIQPIFLLNRRLSPDRERFTIAHELGHLIMHEIPRPEAEAEANRFAAEFLMPAIEIRPQLAKLDLAKAALLKQYWKTAMSALIRRAHDLDVIPDTRYRSLFSQMAQRGFNRVEPVDLPREEPSVVCRILDIHVNTHRYRYDELARLAGLKTDEFFEEFHVSSQRRLRLVR